MSSHQHTWRWSDRGTPSTEHAHAIDKKTLDQPMLASHAMQLWASPGTVEKHNSRHANAHPQHANVDTCGGCYRRRYIPSHQGSSKSSTSGPAAHIRPIQKNAAMEMAKKLPASGVGPQAVPTCKQCIADGLHALHKFCLMAWVFPQNIHPKLEVCQVKCKGTLGSKEEKPKSEPPKKPLTTQHSHMVVGPSVSRH